MSDDPIKLELLALKQHCANLEKENLHLRRLLNISTQQTVIISDEKTSIFDEAENTDDITAPTLGIESNTARAKNNTISQIFSWPR